MGFIVDEIHYDCRHYRGEKPCVYRVNCPYCIKYFPMGYRVLIFKLGAMGDVLRTTSILPSLDRSLSKQHECRYITWVVDPSSKPLLENNPFVHRIWTIDDETMIRLRVEKFDLALCFDKEPRAIGLMALCQATTKRGFIMGAEGSLHVTGPAGEDALLLGISDFYKFQRNQKSYQQTIHELVEIENAGELYVLMFTPEEKEQAKARLAELGATRRPLIGLNTGAGSVFPGKRWPADRFAELGARLAKSTGGTIVLLGGPEEIERNKMIAARIGAGCVDLGTDNPLRRFAAMLGELDLVVAGDTMALHVALASNTKVVALFGPTPHQEVDLGGRGEKIFREQIGPLMGAATEDTSVLQDISVDEVEAACRRVLGR
jgi:heptosyltransferase-2